MCVVSTALMPTTASRVVFWAIALAFVNAVASANAAEPSPPIACVGERNGVCMVPDAVDFHFRAQLDAWLLVLNFGVVTAKHATPNPRLFCEEAYGRKTPDRFLVDHLGWIHVPGSGGVFRARADSTCTWLRAMGIPTGAIVKSIAEGSTTPHTIWALVADGALSSVYRSVDGGASYQLLRNLPEAGTFFQIDTAPGDPATIYITGIGTNARPALARSHDNGITFAFLDPTPAFPDPDRFSSLLAIASDNAKRIYFSRSTPEGEDEVWRTDDAGDSAIRILRLQDGEVVTGFTLGETPGTLYVAGTPLLSRESGAPSTLYVSRNLGSTWEAPIPSTQDGPRYRCLKHRGKILYACAAGETQKDRFLLGQSLDDGRTWTPIVTLATLPAPERCVANLCPETATWLCEKHGVCDETSAGGCGCRVGRPPRENGLGWGLICLLGLTRHYRNRRRRGRNH
jgi:hypothetical protein